VDQRLKVLAKAPVGTPYPYGRSAAGPWKHTGAAKITAWPRATTP